MLIYRFAPVFFLLLLLITNNIYAFDRNTRNLPVSYSTPQQICSYQGGALLGEVTQLELDNTYVDGFKFAYFKPWYQGELNKINLPYLLENPTENSQVNLFDGYSETPDGKFKLSMKRFECACQNGKDLFGMCKPFQDPNGLYEFDSNLTPLQVCTKKRDISSVTFLPLQMNTQDGSWFRPSTVELNKKTWIRDSSNVDKLYYTIPWLAGVRFIKSFGQSSSLPIPAEVIGINGFDYFNCNCNAPSYKDTVTNLCEPFNCTSPLWEVAEGVCGEPDVCPDGGNKLNGNCDRDCDEVGLISQNKDFDFLSPDAHIRCVERLDCQQVENACITKCGSSSNIDTSKSGCNATLGTSSCVCKDDEIDDIVDNETPDENTDASDSLLSNKYLKSIKDETITQSTLLENMNKNDIERNLKLDNINNNIDLTNQNLTETNNKLNDLYEGLDVVNQNINTQTDILGEGLDNLNYGVDEGNGWLSDIWDKLVDIYTFYEDLQEEVLTGTTNAKSKLDSDIEGLETVDGLDINNTVQGYLDTVVSKYSNSLGFSTEYGSKPANITVTLFDKEYTMIDFSVLDEHISVIRSLFLSLAYLTGFFMLLKKD